MNMFLEFEFVVEWILSFLQDKVLSSIHFVNISLPKSIYIHTCKDTHTNREICMSVSVSVNETHTKNRINMIFVRLCVSISLSIQYIYLCVLCWVENCVCWEGKRDYFVQMNDLIIVEFEWDIWKHWIVHHLSQIILHRWCNWTPSFWEKLFDTFHMFSRIFLTHFHKLIMFILCNFWHDFNHMIIIITIQILHLSNVRVYEWESEWETKQSEHKHTNTQNERERMRSVCVFVNWIELCVCIKTKQNKEHTHSLTNWMNKFTFNSKSLMWYTFSFGLDSINFLNISDRE
jgi:hypothetical protein